jgi:asparagine synthase (glutamine-hydrolysing)
MHAAMDRGGRRVGETTHDPHQAWGIGRVHLGVLQPEPQLAAPGPVHVLFHGELFNAAEIGREIAKADGPATADSTTTIVAALYRRDGARFAAALKGTFCAAILDESARRIVLATDRMGSYPVYWFSTDGLFAFASELRALMRVHPKPALDPAAINDLIALTFPFGDKTLAAGVRVLPPASVLTWQWDAGVPSIETYATWAPQFRHTGVGHQEYLERVGQAFDVAMDRAVEGSHRYGLSLSGGLDTRVMLSALDRRHVPLSTFTLGGPGCADEVIGYQLARMAHTDHQFVALEQGALANLLPMSERMVSLTDGMYTSDGFTEVLALQAFEQSDFSILLRGHLGELAKASTAYPFHTDAAVHAMSSRNALVPFLLARLESINHGSSARDLFTEPWQQAYDQRAARQSLETALEGVDLEPPDLCAYLYLHEYHPRLTVPSLEIFREVADVRLPLADPDFIECVFQGPPAWRNGTQIHQTLIKRIDPTYLRVRNPNTGAPAGAGPLQEFVLDKLNSVLRRLNVYGYRHYHSFDGWMRQAFLQIVDRVLLTSPALDRGIVQEGSLRRLVDDARRGTGDHDHVLQVLMLVELWQRENL